MKHTPGPWAVSVGPNPWNLVIVPVAGHPTTIAVPTHHALQAFTNGQEIMTANAKLIAAAPELVECLRECLAYIEQSAAHDGRTLAPQDIPAAVKEFRKSVSVIETGPITGPRASVDLGKCRALLQRIEE